MQTNWGLKGKYSRIDKAFRRSPDKNNGSGGAKITAIKGTLGGVNDYDRTITSPILFWATRPQIV